MGAVKVRNPLWVLGGVSVFSLLVVVAMLFCPAGQAHALTVAELAQEYQQAIVHLQEAEANQERNADQINALMAQIDEKQRQIDASRQHLGHAVSWYYKSTAGPGGLLDFIMGSASFSEAVMRFDTYQKIAEYYRGHIDELKDHVGSLEGQQQELQAQVDDLQAEVEQARIAAEAAQRALDNAKHQDGKEFHQVQGNSENCGATSIAVAVNILLHEERFADNVAVWEGAGFQKDSTTDLAGRAREFLQSEGLGDEISVKELAGDVKNASELKDLLEAGNVVVLSSGSGSTWLRSDGSHAADDAFSEGHWIVFYYFEGGVFYANDSSVSAALGAGVPYDEKQMQEWLDGRSNHFATVLELL